MANLAEEIKASIDNAYPAFVAKWGDALKKMTIREINSDGYSCVICDWHISETHDGAVSLRDEPHLRRWISENGFHSYEKRNSYGVRHICWKL